MQHLTRHGNSYALVIAKPLRVLLDITQETMLRVWTDGRRLIVEPEREPKLLTPPEQITLRQIVMELFEVHGMTRDHVAAIHEMAKPPFSPMFAVGWTDTLSGTATPRDAAIQRRYHALLRARRASASASLPAAVPVALAAATPVAAD